MQIIQRHAPQCTIAFWFQFDHHDAGSLMRNVQRKNENSHDYSDSRISLLRCFAAELPKVITIEGKYAIAETGLEIEAVSTDSTLKYSISARSDFGKKMVGPSKPVSVSEGWLFYVESEDRVWFFNGTTGLVLWQFSYKGGVLGALLIIDQIGFSLYGHR